ARGDRFPAPAADGPRQARRARPRSRRRASPPRRAGVFVHPYDVFASKRKAVRVSAASARGQRGAECGRMVEYLELLLASRLALPLWSAPMIWLALFLANHRLVRATRAATARQHATEIETHRYLTRASEPRWLLFQVLYAAVLFGVALTV